VSLTELDQLTAQALHERSGRVLSEATRALSGGVIIADVRGALQASLRRAGGVVPGNPMLDASFNEMRW
jgi:hypothetical protein